jgi:hypothetical protein
MQEIVLCKKMNQRWLLINVLYKKFWTEPYKDIFVGSYDPLCVESNIFAQIIIKLYDSQDSA